MTCQTTLCLALVLTACILCWQDRRAVSLSVVQLSMATKVSPLRAATWTAVAVCALTAAAPTDPFGPGPSAAVGSLALGALVSFGILGPLPALLLRGTRGKAAVAGLAACAVTLWAGGRIDPPTAVRCVAAMAALAAYRMPYGAFGCFVAWAATVALGPVVTAPPPPAASAVALCLANVVLWRGPSLLGHLGRPRRPDKTTTEKS